MKRSDLIKRPHYAIPYFMRLVENQFYVMRHPDYQQKANQFISDLSGTIRFFMVSGKGQGNQDCLLGIIEDVYRRNKKLTIEIIGSSDSYFDLPSSLSRFINVAGGNPNNFNQTSNQIEYNGMSLNLINARHFFKNQQNFAQTSLAIFVGYPEMCYDEWLSSNLHTHSSYSKLAKADDVLMLNQFQNSFDVGHLFWIGNDFLPNAVRRSSITPLPLFMPDNETIHSSLQTLAEINAPKADFLSNLKALSGEGKISLISVYGLHHHTNETQINSMLTISNAGARSHNSSSPLAILFFNDLNTTGAWSSFQNIFDNPKFVPGSLQKAINQFPSKIQFIDLNQAQNLNANILTQNNTTSIVHVNGAPGPFFKYALKKAIFSVTEGENSRRFLQQEAHKNIFFCARRITTSPMETPLPLLKISDLICPETGIAYHWHNQKRPDLEALAIINQYKNQTIEIDLPFRTDLAFYEMATKKSSHFTNLTRQLPDVMANITQLAFRSVTRTSMTSLFETILINRYDFHPISSTALAFLFRALIIEPYDAIEVTPISIIQPSLIIFLPLLLLMNFPSFSSKNLLTVIASSISLFIQLSMIFAITKSFPDFVETMAMISFSAMLEYFIYKFSQQFFVNNIPVHFNQNEKNFLKACAEMDIESEKTLSALKKEHQLSKLRPAVLAEFNNRKIAPSFYEELKKEYGAYGELEQVKCKFFVGMKNDKKSTSDMIKNFEDDKEYRHKIQ